MTHGPRVIDVSLRAVPADQLRGVGEAGAVVDEEATGAGEFVGLLGDDADGEFFAGQVGAGQFEGFGCVGVLDVHDGGLGVFAAGGQLFEGRCPPRRIR